MGKNPRRYKGRRDQRRKQNGIGSHKKIRNGSRRISRRKGPRQKDNTLSLSDKTVIK